MRYTCFLTVRNSLILKRRDAGAVNQARLESVSLSVYSLIRATDASRCGPPKLQIMLVASPRKSHFLNR
jgi:hypothetical protein